MSTTAQEVQTGTKALLNDKGIDTTQWTDAQYLAGINYAQEEAVKKLGLTENQSAGIATDGSGFVSTAAVDYFSILWVAEGIDS